MHFLRYSAALTAPLAVLAAPAPLANKRAQADITVFTFADVLEQLESSFYQTALQTFQEADFTTAGFTSPQLAVEQFTIIQGDEASHSVTLQAALKAFGAQPVTSCQFDFSSALTDVATMAATARVVENLGVAAYLGGATLLTDPVLLGAAGSILTVEARHQTILNIASGTGTAIPSAFDIGFTPSEVLAIAAPFISGCDLGIPANTPLTITNTGTVAPGTLLTFEAASINGTISNDQLFCQMMIGGAFASIPLPLSQCVVPDGINGPVAIWVTSDGQPLINNVVNRATTQQIAGPAMAFIDTQPQMLGQLFRGSAAAAAPAESTETRTISPEEASAVIASAATDSAAVAAPTDAAASASVSAADPAATAANGASAVAGNGGQPNLTTGKSGDGNITVNGWVVPPPGVDAAAASAATV